MFNDNKKNVTVFKLLFNNLQKIRIYLARHCCKQYAVNGKKCKYLYLLQREMVMGERQECQESSQHFVMRCRKLYCLTASPHLPDLDSCTDVKTAISRYADKVAEPQASSPIIDC